MSDEETAQEQPVTEQTQDQQAEQAVEQAATTLEHRLEDVVSGEHKLVVLAVRLALKTGMHAGIGLDQATDQRFAAIDLPGGQVWWEISDLVATALDGVPLYDKPLEVLTDDVKYQRVLAAL